ncbi:TadE/TadG family type IV pilus assembly protein [Ochrobactrum sp. Marseille-Q0166]|uniref:TadE/TadG family type IV pilus assembly protein n=1 Tax=Ochrobactrum sp. Marseille-Q0166 TaxID=2761105 RepID=UPI0016562078|nr:TadE/TadG family type IV pilus assembly protein [Ochrobactrum sp. Marseille-Q0166]MBC8719091.1 pilus assembly protein [Ochrobactrum sp. Marseille-Q0166]
MFSRFYKFIKDERGASALEFALVSVPFILVIFMILNISLLIIGKQLLSSFVNDEVRDLKINTRKADFKNNYEIDKKLCSKLSYFLITDCNSIRVDLHGYDNIDDKKIGRINNIKFSIERIKQGQIVTLVVSYRWNSVFGLFDEHFAPVRSFRESYEIRTWVNE